MNILNVKIDNFSMTETLNKIEGFLKDGQQHYIVTPNPEIVLTAQNDAELMKILNGADLSVPDGIGLIFASHFLREPIKERVTGVDLIYRICFDFRARTFLLGGRNEAAKKSAAKMRVLWPDLKVETSEESDGVIEKINQFQPDVIFVAFGAPKQEKWIRDNLKKMPSVKIAAGVGGAFDFISGRIKRAPAWTQGMGLEWLWRLAMEPKRIGRIYNAVVKFPLMVAKSKFKKNL